MRAESRQVGTPGGQHSVLLIPRAQQMLSDNTILGVTWSDGDLVVHLALLLLFTHPLTEPLLYAGRLAATHRPRAGSLLQLGSSPHLESPALFHTATRRRFCSSSSWTGLQSKAEGQSVCRVALQTRPHGVQHNCKIWK